MTIPKTERRTHQINFRTNATNAAKLRAIANEYETTVSRLLETIALQFLEDLEDTNAAK